MAIQSWNWRYGFGNGDMVLKMAIQNAKNRILNMRFYLVFLQLAIWFWKWRYGLDNGDTKLKLAIWFWKWRYKVETGDMVLEMAIWFWNWRYNMLKIEYSTYDFTWCFCKWRYGFENGVMVLTMAIQSWSWRYGFENGVMDVEMAFASCVVSNDSQKRHEIDRYRSEGVWDVFHPSWKLTQTQH